MNKLSFAYLPIGISVVLLPILMIVGGRDLGAYGTNNEVTDVFVKMLWFLIPSPLFNIKISDDLIFYMTAE